MSIVSMKMEAPRGDYWSGTGTWENLGKLIDDYRNEHWGAHGEYPKAFPKMERYRKLCNAYYDLYTNCGWNAGRGTARYFGKISKTFAENGQWDQCFAITEPIMDQAILDAARELEFISKSEHAEMSAS